MFDNAKIADVKGKIDDLARLMASENKMEVFDIIEKTLGYYHNTGNDIEVSKLAFPYVDALHFYELISKSDGFHATTREKARDVCTSLDDLVVRSFYGPGFLPPTNDFIENRNGIFQIIPLGHYTYSLSGRTFWSHATWFHPDDHRWQDDAYGGYDWCRDHAIRGNNQVYNFYEYLDFFV